MGIENGFNSIPNYVDLVNLIRSIQRAEGNIDCYRRGRRECDRMDCAWRDHCFLASGEHSKSCERNQVHSHTDHFSDG
jgi:hypothetical protein